MRVLKYINKLMLILLLSAGFASCADDNLSGQSNADRGYAQFRVFSAGVSRAVNQLDSLGDAKKIEVTLLHNGIQLKQALNLSAPVNGADFGLTSEKLELTVGEYELQSYTIYGNPKTVGEDLETLLVVDLDELMPVNVTSRSISEVELDVNSVVRGRVSFLLEKDFGLINNPLSRAGETVEVQDETLFNYKDIAHVTLYYKKAGTQETPRSLSFDTYVDTETGYWRTDTIYMQAQNIEVTEMWLYNPYKEKLILKQDMTDKVEIVANQMVSPELGVQYPANAEVIKDYIALYNIWNGMGGGEEATTKWSYYGDSYPLGANWRFEGRPIDEWGIQPGVTLNNSGRVVQLDLGSFNPEGDIPSALGDLTALESLYLGTHNDEFTSESIPDQEAGIYVLDKWALNHNPNYDRNRDRMEVARVRQALLYPKKESRIFKSSRKQPNIEAFAIKTYQNTSGNATNRITSIPEEIKNLTNLKTLYVASGSISSVPTLPESLEEVEFFNCKKLTEFPDDKLKDLPLVVLNFSLCTGIDAEEYHEGLQDLFNEGNRINETLQLLYLNFNKMEVLPENIFNNIADLRMLDVAYNRITKIPDSETDSDGKKKFRPVSALFANNSISEVAPAFCEMNDVETLDFCNNRLTQFPNLYKDDKALESAYVTGTLDFSSNYISSFPTNFTGVKTETLDLSWNRFDKGDNEKGGKVCFPSALSGRLNNAKPDSEPTLPVSQVQYLQIASCYLDSIAEGSLSGLKTLVALDASGNRLEYMPQEDFNLEVFPYMTGLELSNNAFSVFPVNVLLISSLNSLYLGGQYSGEYFEPVGTVEPCLKDFPSDIYKHLSLRTLDISGNDIHKIPETAFPTQLASFIVTDNPNLEMYIPADICTKIEQGAYLFYYDPTQMILGCPSLDLEN